MKTVSIDLYKFSELSDKSKQTAVDNWISGEEEYPWYKENADSLESFCEFFSLSSLKYEYGSCSYSSASAVIDNDQVAELCGVRLWKYLQNNYNLKKLLAGDCPFTGYCLDECLLDPLRTFIDRPSDVIFQSLIDECLNSWVEAVVNDLESYYSRGSAQENIEMNEYDFLENGEIYR